MKSIIFILPYFGKWPVWFDAFLISVKHNPTINWLCPTDCEIPKNHPENIKFIAQDLATLNTIVNTVVSVDVPLTPRKFCDLKPAYGDIFEEEIKGFDFWGFCDMDIIWGDIRKFMTNDILSNFDIISSRKNAISGHFTLFKNTFEIRELYKEISGYKAMFQQEKLVVFDEKVLSNYLKSLKSDKFTILWSKNLLNQENGVDSHQEYHLDKWQWKNGKMIDVISNTEVMYLHFINWKRTMKYCDINYLDYPSQFYISYNGIHYQTHKRIKVFLNNFKNIFDGYWIREKRRYRKLKFKSLIKRIKNKINKITS